MSGRTAPRESCVTGAPNRTDEAIAQRRTGNHQEAAAVLLARKANDS